MSGPILESSPPDIEIEELSCKLQIYNYSGILSYEA